MGLALAAGALAPQLVPGHPAQITAYSYMFDVCQEFGSRISG